MVLAFASTLAVNAGNLSFTSENDKLIKGCPAQIDIIIDTEWEEVNSVDLGIILNDGFTVNDFDTSEGVYRTYSQAKKMTAKEGDFNGKEFLSMLISTTSPNGYMGEGKLGTLTITPNTDEVTLSFYAVSDYDGQDTNLMVLEDGVSVDKLNKAESKTFKVIEGECTVTTLWEISLEEGEKSIKAEEVKEMIEDTTDVIETNVFDTNQEQTRIESNWLYVAIAIILVIILLVVILKPKKKKE